MPQNLLRCRSANSERGNLQKKVPLGRLIFLYLSHFLLPFKTATGQLSQPWDAMCCFAASGGLDTVSGLAVVSQNCPKPSNLAPRIETKWSPLFRKSLPEIQNHLGPETARICETWTRKPKGARKEKTCQATPVFWRMGMSLSFLLFLHRSQVPALSTQPNLCI